MFGSLDFGGKHKLTRFGIGGMIVKGSDSNLVSSDNNFSEAFKMVKLKEDEGKLAFDLFAKKLGPSIEVILILDIQFWNGETVDMSFDVKFVLFDKITKVVNLSITQKYNGAIFCFEYEGLIWLEGLIHDG